MRLSEPSKVRRTSWRTFSLRALVLSVTICGTLFGVAGPKLYRASRQRQTVESLRDSGAVVVYDYQWAYTGGRLSGVSWDSVGRPPQPKWLRSRLGIDFFSDVAAVQMSAGAPSAQVASKLRLLSGLPRLTELVLDGNGWTGAVLQSLPELDQLNYLTLRGCAIDDQTLARCAPFKSLVELSLDGCSFVTLSGTNDLSAFRAISGLNISRTTADGVALAESLPPTGLVGLTAESARINDAGMKSIGGFSNLESLDIAHNSGVTDAGLNNVGRLRLLQDLNLHGCKSIDGNAFEALAPLWRLSRLDLGETGVSDESAHLLKKFQSLWYLDLSGTTISDRTIGELNALGRLQNLNLSGTRITDAGVARLRTFPSLQMLDVSGTAVSDVGASAIAKIAGLQYVNLRKTMVSSKGVRKLKEALPQVTVDGPGP